MSSGVSTLWATPTRADKHFSAEELATSNRYQRPLRVIGLGSLGVKIVLLIVFAVFGPLLVGGDEQPGSALWVRAAIGSMLVIVALRLPTILVDAWFEYRHQLQIVDHDPVPVRWFIGVAVGLSTALVLILAIVAYLGYWFARANEWWPFAVSGLVLGAVFFYLVGERRLRVLFSTGGERSLDDGSIEPAVIARMAELAETFGLSELMFSRRNSAADEGSESWSLGSREGANAYATGIGRNRRIVLTEALLAEPERTRDFVVAHELTHLARRHVPAQTAMATFVLLCAVWLLALLSASGWPWSWFSLDPLDPIGLPIVVLLLLAANGVVGPAVGWLSRGHERSADRGAIQAVGPLSKQEARSLHLSATADLDPPWWLRLYAHHPTPAERLEFVARHRATSPGHGAQPLSTSR